MSEIRVNGAALYFEVRGSGPPILCIHGTGSSAVIWEEAVTQLAEVGTVIAYDRRGCARSERPDRYERTSVAEHCDDAAALLEVIEADPTVVIGRSYGGEIAVDLAVRRPDLVRSLVLLEPAILGMTDQARTWRDELGTDAWRIARAEGPEAAAEHFYRTVLGDDTWEAFPKEAQQLVRGNGPAILAELRGTPFAPDPADLAKLDIPVLIVSGAASPPAFREVDDALTAMIPGARHEVVGGGHMVDPASEVVLDFVRSTIVAE